MEAVAAPKPKYVMEMSLNVLNHLGMSLYSNMPAVIAEVVANAYDADATEVKIKIEHDAITIQDNGHGMTLEDINNKFLFVGYQRRANGEEISPILKRKVLGRKGIGKLSLFSIADNIEVHTVRQNSKTALVEKNGFSLNRSKIVQQIKDSRVNRYYPEDIDSTLLTLDKGTKIVITNFKKNVSHTEHYLRRRLARRFSVIGTKNQFSVIVNEEPITLADRNFFEKIQFLWLLEETEDEFSARYKFEKTNRLPGKVSVKDGTGVTEYKLSGWIGTVEKPSNLETEDSTNNKISIICRGKMAQEDILGSYNEGGIFADYLIGEIHADFLDLDDLDDIATSSRQSISKEDPRYRSLIEEVYKMLKQIQGVWSEYRLEVNIRDVEKKAEKVSPAIKEWFDSLRDDFSKTQAKKLFATIESLHLDESKEEDKIKKKELYKQSIMAFEKLMLRNSLHRLEEIKTVNDIQLASIFTNLNDLEANLYYDIAQERVNVIKEFQKKLGDNDKEKLLQKWIFDNLWLLNPSWERATEGTALMEQRVSTAFTEVIDSLTEEERNGRMDIKYRVAGGKHVIVELKRYKPTYQITGTKLYEQARKYRNALRKCLQTTTEKDDPIEILLILGEPLKDEDPTELEKTLAVVNARILYYDLLIDESLKAYSRYMEKQKEVSKLRAIIERI